LNGCGNDWPLFNFSAQGVLASFPEKELDSVNNSGRKAFSRKHRQVLCLNSHSPARAAGNPFNATSVIAARKSIAPPASSPSPCPPRRRIPQPRRRYKLEVRPPESHRKARNEMLCWLSQWSRSHSFSSSVRGCFGFGHHTTNRSLGGVPREMRAIVPAMTMANWLATPSSRAESLARRSNLTAPGLT
jgi:hypothetical protein